MEEQMRTAKTTSRRTFLGTSLLIVLLAAAVGVINTLVKYLWPNVIRSVNQIEKELERRKEGVIFVLVVLGLIIFIVSIYYFRAKQQWRGGRNE